MPRLRERGRRDELCGRSMQPRAGQALLGQLPDLRRLSLKPRPGGDLPGRFLLQKRFSGPREAVITKKGAKKLLLKIVIKLPPYGLNMRIPCLFGNMISMDKIYYYQIAYFCPMNDSLWKIIVK